MADRHPIQNNQVSKNIHIADDKEITPAPTIEIDAALTLSGSVRYKTMTFEEERASDRNMQIGCGSTTTGLGQCLDKTGRAAREREFDRTHNSLCNRHLCDRQPWRQWEWKML